RPSESTTPSRHPRLHHVHIAVARLGGLGIPPNKRSFGMAKCRSLVAALAVTAWLLSASGDVSAQQFPTVINITVDEAGNGSIIGFAGLAPLPSALLADPGPGGLAAALTYGLLNPPGLVAGDVLIVEPVAGGLSDLIRFNPNQNGGSLVFYSDPELPGALA